MTRRPQGRAALCRVAPLIEPLEGKRFFAATPTRATARPAIAETIAISRPAATVTTTATVATATTAAAPTRTRVTPTSVAPQPAASAPVVIDPGTVLTPVGSSAPKIAITALQGFTISAGHALHVEATGTVVPSADVEDASFAWDFGDAGSKWNQLPGFNAAHVYERAGTYAATLTVTAPNGSVSTATMDVIVIPASTTQTLYVAANGNDAANGTDTATPLRTLARAVSLAGDDTTILLRRGDTFAQSSMVELSRNGLTLSSYGSGAAPTLLWAGARDRSNVLWVKQNTSNVTVRGLTFDSIYNGDTEQTGMPTAILAGGRDVTIRDNTFLNVGYCINSNQLPKGLLVQDNRAPSDTGVRDYFCWTQGTDIVIVGNQVANSTREHNVRVAGADRVSIVFNKLTNLDRVAQGDKSDNAKGTIACQKGTFAYIADNQLRGAAGIGPLGSDPGLSEKWARFEHARIEQNVEYASTFFVQHGADHITLSQNTVYMDDLPAYEITGWNAVYGRGNTDITLDANVAVNNGPLGHGNFLLVDSAVEGITLTNNVYVAPYLSAGPYNAAGVFLNGSADMSNFNRIDGNTWPSTARANPFVRNTMNAVSGVYMTADAWNALIQVGTDSFIDVTVDGPA